MDQMMNTKISDDLDANNQGDSEAESRGGDHREIQDNGTQNHNSNVQGAWSGNSFPPISDPHASTEQEPDGAGYEISDLGLDETTEVAGNKDQLEYGVTGPAAGGGLDRNTKV